ncbi:MAG TPA: hypothetical protein VNJ08_14995 [Bacteriovoracaceae bacterium]|nr:hypothetical protein [Bacteriovoracaceae bacterium]
MNLFSFMFLSLFLVSCNSEKDQDLPVNSSPVTSDITPSPTDSGIIENGPMPEPVVVPEPVPVPEPVVVSEPIPVPEPVVVPEPAPAPEPIPTPVPVAPVPAQALTWDADIYFVNFSETQEAKVLRAVELMKKVIASKAFKDAIINHTYNGVKTFVDNNGYSNTQIYQKILDGAEKMGNTTKNNTLNVELELYYANTTTIGYTYPSSLRIWMNTKYFNNYTAANVTGNLTHEWLHKLGFGHSSSWTASRASSVPYAVGYLMEKLSKTY